MEYKGDVTVKVDALAASAASVIAMAGTEVLMSPVGMMMLHNPMTIAIGDSEKMQKAGEIPVYVGGTLLDEVVVDAQARQNLRSGREIGMAFVQYLVFDGARLPLPDSYEVQMDDVEADSGGKTEAGTTQRDVVRLGVVSIPVSFSFSPKWLKVLTEFKQREKISVEYFDTETLEM